MRYDLLGEILEAEIDLDIVRAGFKVAEAVYHRGERALGQVSFDSGSREGSTIKLLKDII